MNALPGWRWLAALLIALVGPLSAPLEAQEALGSVLDGVREETSAALEQAEAAGDLGGAAGDLGAEDGAPQETRFSAAVEIAILLTVLSLLPAILISVTSFTRILIVLSFVRRSLAVNELPPNPVLIGLALFLSSFVMAPVLGRVYESAYKPYRDGTLPVAEARDTAWSELRGFLVANTRPSEIDLFLELADEPPLVVKAAEGDTTVAALADDVTGIDQGADGPVGEGTSLDALPFRVIVPAFVLSELKTAFQMGFLLFLPFLVIDLVVASILISMGMFMLPPVMISTPLKILLFVLVDGWHLVCQSLVTSFVSA